MLIEDPKQRGVLIVDDDPQMIFFLEELLNKVEQRNFSANNGTEAVSILAAKGEEIYLVLLDLMMPGMSGLGVVKHLANVHQYPVGVIIITGYASVESAVDFFNSGTDIVIPIDYIQKPFTPKEILEEIDNTLEDVHAKRVKQFNLASENLFQHLNGLENRLSVVVDTLPNIQKTLEDLTKKQQGFLAQLGMELIKAIVIALAIISILYFGVSDFIKNLIP